jgi:hypothetical protein
MRPLRRCWASILAPFLTINGTGIAHHEKSRNYTLRKTGQPHPQNERREPTQTVPVEPRAAQRASRVLSSVASRLA